MIEYIKDGLKEIRHHLSRATTYSHTGEELIIKKYLKYCKSNKMCVDIAASDGTTQSNTLALYKMGWGGIAVEYDSSRFKILASHYRQFPDVTLVRTKVIPANVLSILDASLLPKNFTFFNLDIDSYDYFVLEKVLSKYRPQLICTEVNEKIPAPIEFSVKYSPDHYWHGHHFYGQSISQLYKLCKKFKYKIVELNYANVFIMPIEIKGPKSLTPEDAYNIGYVKKSDRKIKFPYNQDMEELLTLPKKQAIEFLNKKFSKYKGSYILR